MSSGVRHIISGVDGSTPCPVLSPLLSFDDGGLPTEGPDPSGSADSGDINYAELHIIRKHLKPLQHTALYTCRALY